MSERELTFYEFFSGGGMARLGLGADWQCLFANDFSHKKAKSYRSNFPPAEEFREEDVFDLCTADIPGQADLAWASFPCQDLSLAGYGKGLDGARSGSFWGFWSLIRGLQVEQRQPNIVVLENVAGTITAKNGKDFEALLQSLIDSGYRVGPMVIDARHFVPQSRPRLFVVGVLTGVELASNTIQSYPDPRWHNATLCRAYQLMPKAIQDSWIWWRLPHPQLRTINLVDCIEDEPTGVRWHTKEETQRLLDLMSPVNRQKVEDAQRSGRRMVGTIYRRIRVVEGIKTQRAEIRFDNTSGCLRTGSGGSSKQFIMIVEGASIRSRLLSPREAARLMGVPEDYDLPDNYSDAYHLMGDGLAVPVVAWLSKFILVPTLRPAQMAHMVSNDLDEVQLRLLERKTKYAK